MTPEFPSICKPQTGIQLRRRSIPRYMANLNRHTIWERAQPLNHNLHRSSAGPIPLKMLIDHDAANFVFTFGDLAIHNEADHCCIGIDDLRHPKRLYLTLRNRIQVRLDVRLLVRTWSKA